MKIKPLRGYRYARAATSDVSAVVAPPYDQISPTVQDQLFAMSPHNIVRATFGRDEPGGDRYARARTVLDAWLALLLVMLGLFVLAGILALLARSQIKRGTPPLPEQAIREAQLTTEALKTDGDH